MILKVKSDILKMKSLIKHIIFIIAGFCILFFPGCADKSYPGEEALLRDMNLIPEHGTYPIRVSVGNSQLEENTRSSEVKQELTDTVYVYAYSKDMTANYTLDSDADRNICLVDGLMQDRKSKHGKRAMLLQDEPYLTWMNAPKTVYFHDNNQPYDFFAYYLDGAYMGDNEITKLDDRIKMNISINGTNDIMSSKAEVTDEQLSASSNSEADRERVKNMSFSNLTAEWNVQPIFRFKHHMCRFIFWLYAENPNVGGVYIESISVNSKTKGVFTVASSTTGNMGVDFSQEQEYTALFLTDKDRTELDKDTYCPKVDGVDFSKPVYERDAVQVGGELILPPGETQYFYSVKLKQFLNGSWKYNELLNIPLVMPEGETFSPGNQYNVKLSVYGIQEVRTEVTLTPWIFGGSIIIDPDKDFENRNNF